MNYKADSDPLNRLRTMIQVNAHLLSEDDVKEFNDIYKKLEEEYHTFENEVSMNEQLMAEIETLTVKQTI